MSAGRPLKYKTAEELDKAIEQCKVNPIKEVEDE